MTDPRGPWEAPLAEPEERLRAVAFRLLLAEGRPIPVSDLPARGGLPDGKVAEALAALERAGRLVRNSAGDVVGAAGLSVVPTAHEIRVAEERRWTWCAFDALGILAALGRGGRISSRDPRTDAPIEVGFAGDRPLETGHVLLMADAADGPLVEEFCPLVNLFESAENARAWTQEHGATGRVLTLPEAASLGAGHWRPLLDPSGRAE